MTALVLLEFDAAGIKQPSRSAVAAAEKLGEVHALVAGSGLDAAAQAAAKLPGVAKVLTADAPALDHLLAEPTAALLVALAPNYDHLLAATTAVGKNIMPRVAALLDVQPISDIAEVIDADTFIRPIYAGNGMATVKSSDAKKVITVRAASFDPVAAEGGNAPIEAVNLPDLPSVSRFVSAELSKSERPELTAARVVISGGRGMQAGDNFKLLEPIADKSWCRGGCVTRRGGCRFRAQRLSGRADRKDRRPGPLHCCRDIRCHPASGRHEGQQGDRGDQQGRGSAHLPGRRLRPGGGSVRGIA